MEAAGAYYSDDESLYHNHSLVMGTRLDVIIQGQDRLTAGKGFNIILNEASRLDRIMNRFDPASQVSMVNKLAYLRSVVLESELFSLLLRCMDYHRRTSGLFDISMGRMADLVRSESADNPETLVNKMLEHTGMEHILLDEEEKSIRFQNPELSIDLGGFGKGYALDAIRDLLEPAGIFNAFISFGDSSLMAAGNHPYGKGWKAGIQHKFRPQESVYSFDLHDESLSTSGKNSVEGRGSLYSHIIHPEKGLAENLTRYISVKSVSATDAEVLSTVLLLADDVGKNYILHEFPGFRAVQIDYQSDGTASVLELNN